VEGIHAKEERRKEEEKRELRRMVGEREKDWIKRSATCLLGRDICVFCVFVP